MVRLDASVSGSNGNSRISDFLVDGTPSPEDIVSSCEQLEKLRSKFSRLEPESERILKFFMEDVSLSEMARRLGRDRKEFAEQMKKYLGILADHIGR
jgi:DNA-directed RNA polymerase sigma subunit (sigma70/sigma32)